MSTRISPMLAVTDPVAAIEFYKVAFGAEERWRIAGGGFVVAGLTVDGAEFFLAKADPPGTRGPDDVGGTTVRIELRRFSPPGPLQWDGGSRASGRLGRIQDKRSRSAQPRARSHVSRCSTTKECISAHPSPCPSFQSVVHGSMPEAALSLK